MNIRPANESDFPSIAEVIIPVIREGSTYALDRDMTREEALRYWTSPEKEVFVAEEDGRIVGTYFLRANQAGGGAHVCNCGYIVSAGAMGKGIARRMCEHSMAHARTRGFHAMQFNFVVSTNERAVRLWQSLGFEIVGTLPHAFHHPTAGYVDAYVMHRTL
jgi:ribosomal protein S18 acetylase RimI-like enzyme